MSQFEPYLPVDRYFALSKGQELPQNTAGAALFADISGFTPLTELLALQLGPHRGAEELTRHINSVYEALIAQVYLYSGSVIYFSGDAITCWFDDGESVRRAVTAALEMQSAMHKVGKITTPNGQLLTLALKVAVAAGPVKRLLVGDPQSQLLDVIAGETLNRLAEAEHLANKGEVLVTTEVAESLAEDLQVREWRSEISLDATPVARFAVVESLRQSAQPTPWPELAAGTVPEEELKPWIPAAIYSRLQAGVEDFLTELRPAVSLFLRFGGIDYDQDEQAREKLDNYIRWLQGIIDQYNGLMVITIGDKGSYLHISFGAPIASQNDAERAVRAGLAMLNPPPELSWLEGVQIGISRGTMRTGPVGSQFRHIYGVMGDEVNLAARLMQAAPLNQLLVSGRLQSEVKELFEWDNLPPLRVKGKAEPVSVYRVLGSREHRTFHLAEAKYRLPMVGRTEELERVKRCLELVRQGQGQVVGIVGEAGIGKSRLVAEIIQLVNENWAGYGGEAQSHGTNTSYLAWRSVWWSFFNLDPAWSLSQQISQLERELTEIDPSMLHRLPLLGAVLNLSIADNDLTSSLDAKTRKISLEALLTDCVRARAKQMPLMFVLEDCHWLDSLSNDLLEILGRTTADLPVMIVLAYRPPELEYLQAPRITQLPHFTPISLIEFKPEEAFRLISLKLAQLNDPAPAISEDLLNRIMARTQGNPFFIEELLNYLEDRGLNPKDPEVFERIDLPTSLHSLILSRIDQLTESQKITLKVASIIGRQFKVGLLWGAYPELGEFPRVQTDLETLNRLEITTLDQPEPELAYLFRHIATREVAYESLPYATKALFHDQLGQFIERYYHETLDQYVDLLAYHYYQSENNPKKREYLRRAGEAAQATYANTAAINYYQRLLPLLTEAEPIEIMLKLGQVLERIGKWDEAMEQYRRALQLAEHLDKLGEQALCLSAAGGLLMKQKRYGEAEPELRQALSIFENLSDAAGISQTVTEIGEVYRLQGQYGEARNYYEQSLELAEQVAATRPRLAVRAKALKQAGTSHNQQGNPQAAQPLYEESLAILRELDDKPGIAALLNNLGIVARHQSDYGAARKLYEESLALFREIGDPWAVGLLLNNLGLVARYQGDYKAAISFLEESLQIQLRQGDKWSMANTLSSLGDVIIDQGDYAIAHYYLQESLILNQELGNRPAIAYILEYFGGLAAAKADPKRAVQLAGAAAALRKAIDTPLSPTEKAVLERRLTPARQALEEVTYISVWEKGQAMQLEEAIEFALAPDS